MLIARKLCFQKSAYIIIDPKIDRTLTGLCKNISTHFRELSSKCSAAHPKNAPWHNISASHSQNLASLLHNAIESPPWTPWALCAASDGDALQVSCHALRFPVRGGGVTTPFHTPSVTRAALLTLATLTVETLKVMAKAKT